MRVSSLSSSDLACRAERAVCLLRGAWRKIIRAPSPRPSSLATRVSLHSPLGFGCPTSTDPHARTRTHTRAAQQSLISYVKTFEEQPGSPQLKARFLILAGTSPSTRSHRSRLSRPRSPAAQRDGSCKIHKAKQNPNGSFSIGKTWCLHDLQRVQVGKVKTRVSLPVHDTLRGTDKSSPCNQRLIAGRPHVSHLKTSLARPQNAHAVPPPAANRVHAGHQPQDVPLRYRTPLLTTGPVPRHPRPMLEEIHGRSVLPFPVGMLLPQSEPGELTFEVASSLPGSENGQVSAALNPISSWSVSQWTPPPPQPRPLRQPLQSPALRTSALHPHLLRHNTTTNSSSSNSSGSLPPFRLQFLRHPSPVLLPTHRRRRQVPVRSNIVLQIPSRPKTTMLPLYHDKLREHRRRRRRIRSTERGKLEAAAVAVRDRLRSRRRKILRRSMSSSRSNNNGLLPLLVSIDLPLPIQPNNLLPPPPFLLLPIREPNHDHHNRRQQRR